MKMHDYSRRSRWYRPVAAALTLSMFALTGPAYGEQMLLSQNVFVTGKNSQTLMVEAPSAGTMSVTLNDLAWPVAMQSLSFFASDDSSVLTPTSRSGSTAKFDLTGAEAFYAHISGMAGTLGIPGLPNYGAYFVQIGFTPLQAPVPLPASGYLLLLGLAAFGAMRLLRGWRAAPVPELAQP